MTVTILIAVALVLLAAVAVILILAALKPPTFRVERTARMAAPPERIFPLINDFRQWSVWSPWETKDPAMKRTFSGAPLGHGAVYEWAGNKNVGAGRMEIVESSAPSRVAIDLHFIKPFETRSSGEFTLTPEGGMTTVTWAMHGPNLFIGKLMGTLMNMDKMIGKDFEAGLAKMKAAVER